MFWLGKVISSWRWQEGPQAIWWYLLHNNNTKQGTCYEHTVTLKSLLWNGISGMAKMFIWLHLVFRGEGWFLRNDCLKFCMFTGLTLKWISLWSWQHYFRIHTHSNGWFLPVLPISLHFKKVDTTQMPCWTLQRAKRVLLRDGNSDSKSKQPCLCPMCSASVCKPYAKYSAVVSDVLVPWPDFCISSWFLRSRESLKSLREWRSLQDSLWKITVFLQDKIFSV